MLNYDLHRHEEDFLRDETSVEGKVVLKNPFPGLRPFTINESHLFFGREAHVEEVLSKLALNRFVTVMGYSGSGKSSLISCGVVPVVYGGFMTGVSPDWDVISTRPGSDPLANLARSIQVSKESSYSNREQQQIDRRVMSSLLRSNPASLYDVLSDRDNEAGRNTLIFIDQFEELFRFADHGEDEANDARLYTNLIIDACRSEKPIYIAITMRSDYVGECSKYPGLTQLINESNYLVPQMSRDQKRMAIEGPVAVGGGRISARLLKRLLNDLGDNQDQLPIMQHALMRTWDYWLKNRQDNEPIDISHYNAIGQIEQALSQHANETFDELTSREKEIAEVLFKSLSEKTSNSFGMRRPVRLGLVAELAEATDDEVIAVVEKFRAPGRSFLMPPLSVELDANSIIEISHESLMRIWTRLKNWVDEEYESAQMYRRLSEAAAMYQIGRTGLWRPPDLQLALNWQKKQKPTRAWAKRYDEAFERAIVFLDTSRITYEAEQRNQEMLQKRLLKRTRAVAVILGVAAVISILFFVYAFTQSNEAQRQTQIALAERNEAQRQRDIAEEATIQAQKNEREAQRQREIAEKQRQRAEDALIEAQRQRQLAEQNFLIAQEQTTIAQDQREVAEDQRNIARQEYQRAEENFKEAQRLLYQTTAQAMAVKSLAIEDNNLKGLLALQAKQFMNEYDGRKYDPYIYQGLSEASMAFTGPYRNAYPRLHKNAVRAVAIGDDHIFSTGTEGKVISSDVQMVSNDHQIIANNGFPNRAIALSPSEQYIALASDSSYVQVFELGANSNWLITGHSGFVNDLSYINDNQFYSVGSDRTLRINTIGNQSNELVLTTSEELKSLDYNNTKKLAVGGTISGKVILIDLIQKSESILFDNKGLPVQSVAFSPDGEMLAFGDERGVTRLISVPSGSVLQELSGHKGRVSSIKFSKDGALLASASFDGSVQIWPVDELDELPLKINANNGYVWDIGFTDSGDHLFTAYGNGSIKRWPTDAAIYADEMCERLTRNMDLNEWNTYVGDDIDFRETCGKQTNTIDK